MTDDKPAEASPERAARANRERLTRQEATQAMADVAQEAVAVRKNMERLRALRQAKEADEARAQAALPSDAKPPADAKKKRKKLVSR
jgi:hypothetical protein